jgi:FkbM family methyltransferase
MSQFGADKWVLSHTQVPGFYLDVGCHDGVYLSNTNSLEKLGWKGLCIDPFPRNFQTRKVQVVEAVVYSESGKEVTFDYSIEDPACSGISEELGRHKERLYTTTTIEKCTFKTRTLQSILEEYDVPQYIDYMSLDIEGSEYEVLRVFPFDKWTIKMMSVEHNYEEPKRTIIREFLESKGYKHDKAVNEDDWYILTDSK